VRGLSCIEEGRDKEFPRVTELDADTDENIEVAGEALGSTLEVVLGGVSVMGSPRSPRICIALMKSAGLWNFNCIRRIY
jgi:hypothetical protein